MALRGVWACSLAGDAECHAAGQLSAGKELELELIQSHMAQKPVLKGEVGCACGTVHTRALLFVVLIWRAPGAFWGEWR